jgi:hypothetical protein
MSSLIPAASGKHYRTSPNLGAAKAQGAVPVPEPAIACLGMTNVSSRPGSRSRIVSIRNHWLFYPRRSLFLPILPYSFLRERYLDVIQHIPCYDCAPLAPCFPTKVVPRVRRALWLAGSLPAGGSTERDLINRQGPNF